MVSGIYEETEPQRRLIVFLELFLEKPSSAMSKSLGCPFMLHSMSNLQQIDLGNRLSRSSPDTFIVRNECHTQSKKQSQSSPSPSSKRNSQKPNLFTHMLILPCWKPFNLATISITVFLVHTVYKFQMDSRA